MKKSFVLYHDQFATIQKLSKEQKGDLLELFYLYNMGEELPERDPIVDIVFSMFESTFKRDNSKYLERCEKNKDNAKKRWDAKDANVCDRMQSDAKHADSDSGKIVTVVGDSDKEQKLSPPKVEDSPFYLTKKKKKLTGKRLESFERFWMAFDYKKGKPSAADAWVEIKELTDSLVNKICEAAKAEAVNRLESNKKGLTPKMAQGWISDRRWEDEGSTRGSNIPTFMDAF